MGIKLVAAVLFSRGGGSIVNTASIAGVRGSPGLLAYSVSKHAVRHFLWLVTSRPCGRSKSELQRPLGAPIFTAEFGVTRNRSTGGIGLGLYTHATCCDVARLSAAISGFGASGVTGSSSTKRDCANLSARFQRSNQAPGTHSS